MKKETRKCFWLGIGFLAAFGLWTLAVLTVDVHPIGPRGSAVGFATVNGWVHRFTGVHMALYAITDWLSLVPLLVVLGFGLLGLWQWVRRKELSKVDRSLFVLGGFYVVVMAAYIFFEAAAVNYRPVLIEGILEASYPSSTTMLVMCVMATAMMELKKRIRNPGLKRILTAAILVFTVLMVTGRLLSGVHWISDIIGGALLSAGLLWLYCAARKFGEE